MSQMYFFVIVIKETEEVKQVAHSVTNLLVESKIE